MKLNEAVCLFDCDLSKPSVFVENVEDVTFSNFVGWEIACLTVKMGGALILNIHLPINNREPMGNLSHCPSVT